MKPIILVLCAVVAAGAPWVAKNSALRFNYTDSCPIGVYRTVAKEAHYALICMHPAETKREEAAGLFRLPGECTDGKAAILKPVYTATDANPITFGPAGFLIHGKLMSNTAPKAHSKTGVPLSHTAFGTYRAGLWAISDFNRDSYDSRYFGEVQPSTIRCYAKQVLVF